MGSAIFYLKARYPSDVIARNAADELLPYIEELERMETRWQKLRSFTEQSCTERLQILLEKYPKATEFLPKDLRCPESGDPHMNFLSHIIPDVEPSRTEFDLVVKGNTLYMKSWAWQHSNWNPIVRWLLKHGALSSAWASSQDVGEMPGPKDWKPGGATTPFDRF